MIRIILSLAILILTAVPGHAMAQDSATTTRPEMRDFASLPILHEGRVKPLDSVARVELRKIYGDDRFAGTDATAWLARVLFDPGIAAQDRIFRIRDAQVRTLLKLEDRPGNLYSLTDIGIGLDATAEMIPGLLQQSESLTPSQKNLLAIHESALSLSQLLGAVNMLLPMGDDGRSWIDLRGDEQSMRERVAAIVREKGSDPSKFDNDERTLAALTMHMNLVAAAGRENTLFRVIPGAWAGADNKDHDTWLSPWAILQDGRGSPASASYLRYWQDMAAAWHNGDAQAWKTAIDGAREQVAPHIDIRRMGLETTYNAVRPLLLAEWAYGLALLFLVLSFRWKTQLFYRMALAAGLTACIAHGAGIVIRSILLARPPVGTLYESLLFVSLSIFVVAFLIELARRDRLALLAGIGGALALLYAAPVFTPAGDSLEMLVAVLNTGFWLTTHVLCITIGYGVSILAAMIAHFALLRGDGRLDALLQRVLVAALFFTAFGTMLGGIWADQSWGRFWGWDPKENGALLIVVWIAWILHGKYGGYLRGITLHMAAAYLNVIVALAWFGVNLLNIGLHSYGFTDEMAFGLAAFCIFETGLIVAAWLAVRRRARKPEQGTHRP